MLKVKMIYLYIVYAGLQFGDGGSKGYPLYRKKGWKRMQKASEEKEEVEDGVESCVLDWVYVKDTKVSSFWSEDE